MTADLIWVGNELLPRVVVYGVMAFAIAIVIGLFVYLTD